MFRRCLVCATAFPPNEVLEHLPNGERFAFDAGRGRLWAICRACRRWSLAPMEDRWEALEELEKLTTDRARLLSQTEHISLLRAGPVEIVRVGRARLAEEAWWRYGRELTSRREQARKIGLIGTVAVGAAALGGWATGAVGGFGIWWMWHHVPDGTRKAVRWLRFGSTAWRGSGACEHCGHSHAEIRYRDRGGLLILPGEEHATPQLFATCPKCHGYDRRRGLPAGSSGRSGFLLSGNDAERTLRRVLAYHHFSGASERRVKEATGLIESAGSTHRFTASELGRGKKLAELKRTPAIALEIAANEAAEQRLLEMEVAELEAVWREEEEIAAIVDGELTPLPLLEQLRRRVAGQEFSPPAGTRL